MSHFWIVATMLFSSSLFALGIPQNLSKDDRTEVIRLLGFNTSTKLLTNPSPLGGYSGFEAGVAVEFVDVSELSQLGSTTSGQSELHYPSVSIGKGLYDDIDVFLHFIPPLPGSRISEFGALMRWAFLEGEYVPMNLSLVAHANRIGIQDSFSCKTYGIDLISGLNVNDFSIYVGGGYLMADAQFTGSTSGSGVVSDPSVITNTNLVYQSASTIHSVLGLTYQMGIVFFAAQVDRYRDPVYSAKLGVRF